MRKIIGGMFVSRDDVIQAPGGPTEDPTGAFAHGGWMFPVADDQVGAPMGDAFTAVNKYVLTRGPQPLPWTNSHRVRTVDDVAALKRDGGPDLLIQGSSMIYPALLAAGLLDRLVLYTFLILLGSGKRLFGEGTPPGTLKLVDQQISSGGTVIATYEPAGSVETGSFGQIGSAREDKRQAKMKDGTW
ncbi:MAG: dihydrofolate reductase family protein [Gammaproteobacteria bacterium]